MFGQCGGCQYQDIPYEEELRLKETALREVLALRFGEVPGTFKPIVPSPKIYGYRNRIIVHTTIYICCCNKKFCCISRKRKWVGNAVITQTIRWNPHITEATRCIQLDGIENTNRNIGTCLNNGQRIYIHHH